MSRKAANVYNKCVNSQVFARRIFLLLSVKFVLNESIKCLNTSCLFYILYDVLN